MTSETINWATVGIAVILALVAAAVPVTLSYLLGRKNANKKLNLDETSVMLLGTDAQIKTYQDLLNRADRAITKAEDLNTTLAARVSNLEETRNDQIWQITTLRSLFKQVVQRSGIILTTEEQIAFDSTKPIDEVRRVRKPKSV